MNNAASLTNSKQTQVANNAMVNAASAPKVSANLDVHLKHAYAQLKAKGYTAYYTAMVNACLSQVHPKLSFAQFSQTTDRATRPLTSPEACVMYSTLYGMTHFNRFYHTLKQVLGKNKRTKSKTQTLHVYDYGCGQALASLALLSYIEHYVPCNEMTLHIHLIEPSASALAQANKTIEHFAARLSATVHVHTYCKTLNDYFKHDTKANTAVRMPDSIAIESNQVDSTEHSFCLHLLSNVLDIEAVQQSIPQLAAHIEQFTSKQLLIAVGPNFSKTSTGFRSLVTACPKAKVSCAINRFEIQSEYYSLRDNHWINAPVNGLHLSLAIAAKSVTTVSTPMQSLSNLAA